MMLSERIQQYVQKLPAYRQAEVLDFDELMQTTDDDFAESGLKLTSVIRVGRLAVVEGEMLLGAIGQIAPERLQRIKRHLAEWLKSSQQKSKCPERDENSTSMRPC